MVESILEIGYFLLPCIVSNEWLMLWWRLLKVLTIDDNGETTCKTKVCSTDLCMKQVKGRFPHLEVLCPSYWIYSSRVQIWYKKDPLTSSPLAEGGRLKLWLNRRLFTVRPSLDLEFWFLWIFNFWKRFWSNCIQFHSNEIKYWCNDWSFGLTVESSLFGHPLLS